MEVNTGEQSKIKSALVTRTLSLMARIDEEVDDIDDGSKEGLPASTQVFENLSSVKETVAEEARPDPSGLCRHSSLVPSSAVIKSVPVSKWG